MMDIAEALRRFFTAALGSGWTVQFGRWMDEDKPLGGVQRTRYAVIRPAGGPEAGLVRRPQFTLVTIGLGPGDNLQTADGAARCVVAAQIADEEDREGLVSIEVGEPVFMATQDGRPVFESAVSVIV
jgi:hypothetical protein